MEYLGRTNKQNNAEKTSTGFSLIFPLNESFLSYLRKFSKEDGHINKYMSAISKEISLSPGDDYNPQDWNNQERSVYLYFHLICAGYSNLFEKFRLSNSLEKSKLIREEIEQLIERGYTSFCESVTTHSTNNFTFSDINLNHTEDLFLFTQKNEQEATPDSSQFKIRITEDLSLLNSSEENFLNFNSKIVTLFFKIFYSCDMALAQTEDWIFTPNHTF